MKYCFVAIVIFAVFCYANAECSDDESKVIKKCYSKFMKTINIKNSHQDAKFIIEDDKELCGIYNEHVECLKNGPSCFVTSSFKEMAKILDTNQIEFGLGTKEDAKCFATLTTADIEKDCKRPEECKDVKEFSVCFKKALIHKCKNEKLSKLYAEAMEYGLNNTLVNC